MNDADILVLDPNAAKAAIGELAEVLTDCVAGGASVSFMLPYTCEDGARFFEKVVASVARAETVLIAAKLDGRIVGTVQLGLDMPPNSRIAAISKSYWCIARRAGMASARR